MQTKEDRVTPSLFSLQISDSITRISKRLKINVAFDSVYFYKLVTVWDYGRY